MTSGVYIRTEETKRKIKKARTGTHHSKESKRKISEAMIGNQYNLGKHPSLETKKKMSDSHKGMNFSEQHRKNISKAKIGNQYNLGKHFSEETKRKMSNAHKGKVKTKEHLIKIGLGNKGKPGKFRGKHHSEETKRMISESHKGTHPSKKAKRKMSKSAKKRWQNPEYREKQLKAIFTSISLKPTKPERKLRRRLNKLFPNEYKYVGNGMFLIGGYNPDFVNIKGQKKVIEMFGDYWHSKKVTGVSKKEHMQKRINHFAKYRFKTLIIWECELKNILKLKRKLRLFNEK